MKSKSEMKKTIKSYDCSSFVTQSTADTDIEIYKRIPEDNSVIDITSNNTKSIDLKILRPSQQELSAPTTITTIATEMVQENIASDGADEEMLRCAEDNDKLAIKRDEVKFIKGDHQNGDAKIDIGVASGAQFTGMSKDDLMKYANDPFWVRLRWIFFIAFWLIWLGMLAGAIFIIMDAPKCAAPEPLPWYKRGLIAKFNKLTSSFTANHDDVLKAQEILVNGVIYELPPEQTYSLLDQPEIEENIKNLINHYKDTDINVILDVTPNYVTKSSRLMQDALADEAKRSAFIWMENVGVPNNWLSLINGSAWFQISEGNYVLSQFGEGLYDLHMNDTIVKRELSLVLSRLIDLGVKGVRLKNTKFYIINKNSEDEVPALENVNYDLGQYGFWTHTQTTFQKGLGNVLQEYMAVVKNKSHDTLFTVADDIIRPDVYRTDTGDMAIDIPIYGRLIHSLSMPNGRHLTNELVTLMSQVKGTLPNWLWLQWNLEDIKNGSIVDRTAIELFTSLLPGTPIVPISAEAIPIANENDFNGNNVKIALYKHIKQLRMSPSFMHGDFKVLMIDSLLAYTRIKSGNPGYLVVFNPTSVGQKGNFTLQGLPEKMSIDSLSDNFAKNSNTSISKTNILIDELEIPALSTIILSYVPVKTD